MYLIAVVHMALVMQEHSAEHFPTKTVKAQVILSVFQVN
jgi:hypothetical protein